MSSFLRPVPRVTARFQSSILATSSIAPRRLAHGDYGSGSGDPVGENPQAQGKNPREDAEHPGPPPPSAARQGNNKSSSSEQSQQKEQSPSSGQNKGNDSNTSSSPQPRIHNHSHNSPSANQEEVDRHNQELERRRAKTAEQSKDEKVDKGFWSGTGGADREPRSKHRTQQAVLENHCRKGKDVTGNSNICHQQSRGQCPAHKMQESGSNIDRFQNSSMDECSRP